MSRPLDSKLVYLSPDDLAAEVAAKEAAIRERAFELGRTRTSPRDEIRDWLDAERAVYRRPNLRLALVGSAYQLEVELPGIDPNDLSIRLGGDRIIFEANRSASPADCWVDEFGATPWWREQRLPEDARTDRAEISFDNGILKLVLARAAERSKPETEVVSKVAPPASVNELGAAPRVAANPKAARSTRAPAKPKKPAKRTKSGEA